MCDIESYIYLPMLEELDYIPTRRYAYGEEILGHLEAIADRFDLTDDALFHTGYCAPNGTTSWRGGVIETDRGDQVDCRWYVLAVGILNLLKLPDIEGMEDFAGASFHTARWDYGYTGGGPMSRSTPFPTRSSRSSAPGRAACSVSRSSRHRRNTSTCSSARHRPSVNEATGPPTRTSPTGSNRAGSAHAWTTSRVS